jgi:hypothetical protein
MGEIFLESGDIQCPEHAIINKFSHSQCPGCVSGWGDDCPLFKSFAYSHRVTITPVDLINIERGICPKRVNGTFGIRNTGSTVVIEDMDLSEQATTESGLALADGIRDYIKKYSKEY